MSYAFDTYAAACAKEALEELLANRAQLTEPITWIKLQQGGQGEIAVSHVTVNHGEGRERSGMTEVSLELGTEATFPTYYGEANAEDDEGLAMLVATYEVDEDDAWEVPETVLHHELLVACSTIRQGLREAGIQVAEDCIVCCGDEDNTWGWTHGRPWGEATSLEASDFEELGETSPSAFLELVYASGEKRAWLGAIIRGAAVD